MSAPKTPNGPQKNWTLLSHPALVVIVGAVITAIIGPVAVRKINEQPRKSIEGSQDSGQQVFEIVKIQGWATQSGIWEWDDLQPDKLYLVSLEDAEVGARILAYPPVSSGRFEVKISGRSDLSKCSLEIIFGYDLEQESFFTAGVGGVADKAYVLGRGVGNAGWEATRSSGQRNSFFGSLGEGDLSLAVTVNQGVAALKVREVQVLRQVLPENLVQGQFGFQVRGCVSVVVKEARMFQEAVMEGLY